MSLRHGKDPFQEKLCDGANHERGIVQKFLAQKFSKFFLEREKRVEGRGHSNVVKLRHVANWWLSWSAQNSQRSFLNYLCSSHRSHQGTFYILPDLTRASMLAH